MGQRGIGEGAFCVPGGSFGRLYSPVPCTIGESCDMSIITSYLEGTGASGMRDAPDKNPRPGGSAHPSGRDTSRHNDTHYQCQAQEDRTWEPSTANPGSARTVTSPPT